MIEAGAGIRQARRATAIPGLALVSPRLVCLSPSSCLSPLVGSSHGWLAVERCWWKKKKKKKKQKGGRGGVSLIAGKGQNRMSSRAPVTEPSVTLAV